LTILCVGEEPNLLAYRALLLKSIGASVQVTSGAAAPKLIKREEFSLIVVGHTVGDESARIVYEAAKARTPRPIVLRLKSSWHSTAESDAEKYSDAVSSTDPAELVHLITELLKL
jgi:DNA-binding response OmpR family regulator